MTLNILACTLRPAITHNDPPVPCPPSVTLNYSSASLIPRTLRTRIWGSAP